MRRLLAITIGLGIGLSALASSASAQWGYPMGYGGYGMSQWGADPAAGYMAGLGTYARGQGVYQVDQAKADAINVETAAKWNKALRARQLQLRQDQQREAAAQDAAQSARVQQIELRDGTTVNKLLLQILDADPLVVRSSRAQSPISTAAVLEIPFEWDSEAITTCIDQMTGKDALPPLLMRPTYADERQALQAAVKPALDEDAKGTVSIATRKRMDEAIAQFRAKFLKNSSDFEAGYSDALDYFTTMASLSRLLNDPSMKAFLAALEKGKERTVGQLVAFMNAYNLRFGPATSDRQIEIYAGLVPALTAIRDAAGTEKPVPPAPDPTGAGLRAAARQAFKGMTWDQLEAHARGQ